MNSDTESPSLPLRPWNLEAALGALKGLHFLGHVFISSFHTGGEGNRRSIRVSRNSPQLVLRYFCSFTEYLEQFARIFRYGMACLLGVTCSNSWLCVVELMIKRCLFLSILAVGMLTSSSYADGSGDGYGGGGSGHPAKLPGDRSSDRAMAKRTTLGTAGPEQATEAVAHFARARSLIIAALHEFDKGRKIASPSELLDAAQWRNTLIDRAEDLDRVLDPQPRATKGGIRFEADPRLLPEADR